MRVDGFVMEQSQCFLKVAALLRTMTPGKEWFLVLTECFGGVERLTSSFVPQLRIKRPR